MTIDDKYAKMQQAQYDNEATTWTPINRGPVVGSFDEHNNWPDYDNFLFKGVDTSYKTALDFGCGPGRNIVKFASKFNQIDGVDISDVNLINARLWFKTNNLTMTPVLYKNNGLDLSLIPSDHYDVVFSTICLQHICVHEIRFNLMKEFYRVLKTGGSICHQMGFGIGRPGSVSYYENNYDASGTNGHADTRVESPDELKLDLDKIGFSNFTYDIRPVGPGDHHQYWIFFRATK
jgi:SAM-dependent methyltransferase